MSAIYTDTVLFKSGICSRTPKEFLPGMTIISKVFMERRKIYKKQVTMCEQDSFLSFANTVCHEKRVNQMVAKIS